MNTRPRSQSLWCTLPLIGFFVSEWQVWRQQHTQPNYLLVPMPDNAAGLPPYPVDMSPMLALPYGTLDEDEVPYNTRTEGSPTAYQPTTIAQYALARWNAYLATGDEKHKQAFMIQAHWFLDHELRFAGDAGGWPIPFPSHSYATPESWLSALTQGNVISVLIRAYRLTGKDVFLQVACRAIRTFELDIRDGGVSTTIGGGGIFFEEVAVYPATHILNGYILALLGLFDYVALTGDLHIEELIRRSLITLHTLIDGYDTGYWSCYDLYSRHLATPFYHALHVTLLQALARYSGCQHCSALASRWAAYTYKPGYFIAYRIAVYRSRLQRKLARVLSGGANHIQTNVRVRVDEASASTGNAQSMLVKKTTLIRIAMDIDRDQQDQGNERRLPDFEQGRSLQMPRLRLPSVGIGRQATHFNLSLTNNERLWSTPAMERDRLITETKLHSNVQSVASRESHRSQSYTAYRLANLYDTPTMVLPVAHVERSAEPHAGPREADTNSAGGQVILLRKLVTHSGIYALSSIAVPLVSLVLAPFLTHHLSLYDYGALAITNTAIGLAVGITQLGLSSAFFRAYGYDYSAERDRRDVVASVTTLLCLVSIPVTIVIAIMAPWLADLFFGHPSLGNYISLASGVVLLQNLTVPGMAWLRAENRPLLYSLLSISNLLVTLLATIYLIGVLNWGVPGAIIANGLGYAFVVICTLPIIVLRTGIKLRADIAKNLLAFGLPLVLNFVSYWVLQLLDRYLLSLFASLAETAKYTVAYTLGSVMSVVIIGPFTLAWPTAMFSIARRKDAVQVFKLVFRWLSMLLLFAAFGFTLVATFILDWLFPAAYHSVALVIPIVAESLVFYGLYFIFMAGANIQRKTWLAAVFTTIAAIVNVALNLVLIPLYGAMGAAVATLVAYIVLALAAYIANQRLYPIPFEVGRFTAALLIGVGLYVGSIFLAQNHGTYAAWGFSFGALALYGGCLALLGKFPAPARTTSVKTKGGVTRSSYENPNSH